MISAYNITTDRQKDFLKRLTNKSIADIHTDEDTELQTKTDTLRGKKYDFIIKMMKKCNSTDIGDIMLYCRKQAPDNYKKTWTNIHKNTPNLQNIITAAASDIQIHTRITPIWEQIRQKKDLFNNSSNHYWTVQKSLDIYDAWCSHHNIDAEKFAKELFEVCHKIRAKINGFHITGPSNSVKSYILRSIKNGLMNCGRMRCQASDNFTFGSCVDKSLIFTEEMWFTPQNIEEAKCILEGADTYVNVKHQQERILKRTPCISTSNKDPWRHVAAERQTMENRIFSYTTKRTMPQLKQWGVIELNPLMWLTIWRTHIEQYINNSYNVVETNTQTQPKRSKRYSFTQTDQDSPKRRKKKQLKETY